MKSYSKLKTDRLILRAFTASDALMVQFLAGDYEIAKTTLNIPHPYKIEMADSWIASHKQEFQAGRGVVWALVEQDEQELIGAAGLTITQRFNRAELGYWIGKPYWGQGFATEAARRVLEYGFMELKMNKIYATHMTLNPASGRVMQKIGMEKEGFLKQHALKWDQFVDLVAYGILAKTWQHNNKM